MVSSAPGTHAPERLREPHRFSRADYDAMISAGILEENDRVELISGEILTKIPIGPTHASTVKRLNRIFSIVAGERCIVSVQDPIALDPFSQPEPDLALLTPRPDHYASSHPTPQEVFLIVEVADSSLRFDRERKIPLYAAAGIPEVWLEDLVDKSLTCFRHSMQGAYSEISRHVAGESVPIPSLPNARLAIAELAL